MSKVPSSDTLLSELVDLYANLVIPFMKIRRDMPFPTEPERDETDGEHAYTLAMLAITLAERLKLGLDTGLIAHYALVHDLVEVHAGDTSVRASDADLQAKVDKEHEAFLLIKEKYLRHAPWIAEHIERYESRVDEESKFVYAADKMMGALARMAGDGAGWASYYPEANGASYHRIVKNLRKKAAVYPPLLDLFDTVHTRLDDLRPAYFERTKDTEYRQP